MKTLLVLTVVVLLSFAAFAQAPVAQAKPQIMPLSEVRNGMRGIALTVFEGTKPEPMDVEILGVMRNMSGPKGHIILARLHGKKVEFTGVVAGMSGSPVYIDGKLAGAIAYRIGEFSKEPIAGITPIEHMLEINELDRTQPPIDARTPSTLPRKDAAAPTSGPGQPVVGLQDVANFLKPIEAPMVFNGFSPEALKLYAPQFAAAGVVPVLGAGGVNETIKQPEPLVPGSAVSAVMVRGDLNISATCTVTYVDPERLLACGHPLLNFGSVEMPMNKAQIVATLPSASNAFKIANATEPIGAFVQDRHTGIMGVFGKQPRMIPVTLTVEGGTQPKTFHFEVLNNARLTPASMMSSVYSAIQGINEYGEDVTYRLQGAINVKGYPTLKLQNMFAPGDGGSPSAMGVANAVGDRFSQIYQNPWATPDVTGVNLTLQMVRERRWARLETARTDVTEVVPGDEIVVETVLRPYRGERLMRQIPVRIPASAPRGTLRILVSDGDTLDRMRRMPQNAARRLELAQTIAMLNKEHSNTNVYVSLLEPNPQAVVQDKVMPGLPVSVMNVMDGMRGTQEMVVSNESAVNEASAPLDYVVAGSQIITVTVK